MVTSAARAAEFDCVIQPRQILEIRSPLEGLIDRISVERGDRVRKGQEIAFVDTSVERVLAESAKYRSETESAIRAARSKVELGSRKFKRAQDLLEKGFVTQQAVDEAANEFRLAGRRTSGCARQPPIGGNRIPPPDRQHPVEDHQEPDQWRGDGTHPQSG